MVRNKRDFRERYEEVEKGSFLMPHTWYRSPWWEADHLVGEDPVWYNDQLAWCGRPLGAALEWDSDEMGGLWISTRTGGKCATCRRKQKEWNAAMSHVRT